MMESANRAPPMVRSFFGRLNHMEQIFELYSEVFDMLAFITTFSFKSS